MSPRDEGEDEGGEDYHCHYKEIEACEGQRVFLIIRSLEGFSQKADTNSSP